jgi:hypothetical protein
MKIAIAQIGPEDAGKTTTIRMMYDLLLDRRPDAIVESLLDRNADIRAVVTVEGIKIGIESQGDPWKKAARLDPSLALFVRLKCDVIICATRTRGGTLGAFSSLKDHGYTITLRPRDRDATANQQKCNRAEAQWMLEQIENQFATATV